MWDNKFWAQNHIRKHQVTVEEAWEVVFDPKSKKRPYFFISDDQLNWPPYRRYWTIGKTHNGRLLFVVWEQFKESRRLITAFPPSDKKVKLYEKAKKKKNY